MSCIKSRSHNWIVHLKNLYSSSTYRKEKNELLIFGEKLILEYTGSIKRIGFSTLCKKSISDNILKKYHGIPKTLVCDAIFQHLFHEYVVAEVQLPLYDWNQPIKRLLVLDGLQDPRNIGALIRSAAAFGWFHVFCLPKCSDFFHPEAIRASMGAFSRIHLKQGDLAELSEIIRKNSMKVVVSSCRENSAEMIKMNSICLVVGSESHGIQSDFTSFTPSFVHIDTSDLVDSLNVAVAGSILMHSASRL